MGVMDLASRIQSSLESVPFRTFCMSTRASEQSMRIAICSRGISSVNTATFLPWFKLAWEAMFMAKEVLPMEGRAPTTISSPP